MSQYVRSLVCSFPSNRVSNVPEYHSHLRRLENCHLDGLSNQADCSSAAAEQERARTSPRERNNTVLKQRDATRQWGRDQVT